MSQNTRGRKGPFFARVCADRAEVLSLGVLMGGWESGRGLTGMGTVVHGNENERDSGS